MIEVTRRLGKQWQTMGVERGGLFLLQPEEALYMLETVRMLFDSILIMDYNIKY